MNSTLEMKAKMTLENDIDTLGADVAVLVNSSNRDDDVTHDIHRRLRRLSDQLANTVPAPPGLHTKIDAITSALLSLFDWKGTAQEVRLQTFKDFYG